MLMERYECNEVRNRKIDILKGICVLMVIITHSTIITEVMRKNMFFPFTIDMAVPIFMILTGYNYSSSIKKRNQNNLGEWYKKENFKPKIERLLFPYLIALILGVFASYGIKEVLLLRAPIGIGTLIHAFYGGGYGPGSYYIPVIIQIVIIFPFLYYLFRWNNLLGMAITIVTHFAFEVFVFVNQVDPSWYRVCAIRYLVFVMCGVFLYHYTSKLKKTYILHIAFFIGFSFILGVNYLGYKPIITNNWLQSAIPVAGYVLGFTELFLISFPTKRCFKIFELVGKASYHIFLTQMCFYISNFSDTINTIEPCYLVPIINIIVCCMIGIIFYFLHQKLIKLLVSGQ